MPPEDATENKSATFDEADESFNSQYKPPQVLPLALTTGFKSPAETFISGSTFKQPITNDDDDAAFVNAMESEGSAHSISPFLRCNTPSAEVENLVSLADNTPANESSINSLVHSEEETQTDLGAISLFKAPLASSHSVVKNVDSELDDAPLSLCISKPGADDSPANNDESYSTNEPKTSPCKNPNPAAVSLVPALSPPSSPRGAIPEENNVSGSGPQEPLGKDAAQGEVKSEPTVSGKSLAASNPEPEKDARMESHSRTEKPSDDPETPPVAPPPPPPQPPRPDKPYSCSHCGKAYASRSGLKVRGTVQ